MRHLIHAGEGVEVGDAPVEGDAQRIVRHVRRRQEGRHRQIERDGPLLRRRLAGARLLDGGVQEPRVEIEADRRDMAALLRAEDVARAANLQIAHRQLEARAEVSRLLDRLQALLRLRRHRLRGVVEEVGVGAVR